MGSLVQELQESPDDKALWQMFVKALYPKVMYSAYRLTAGDSDVAQDLVQQAFVRFIEYGSIARIVDDEHALAYIRTAVKNLWWNEQKRQVHEETHQSMDYVPATDDVENEELRDDLRCLIGKLSTDDQRLVELLICGHTLTEAAENLGISYSAAGVRLHRLKKNLRSNYVKNMKSM